MADAATEAARAGPENSGREAGRPRATCGCQGNQLSQVKRSRKCL